MASAADWLSAARDYYINHMGSAGASSSGAPGGSASGGASHGGGVPTPASSGGGPGGQQGGHRDRNEAIVAMFGPNLRAAILSPENRVSSTFSC